MGEKERILKCEKVLKIGEPAQEETIAKYDDKTGEYLSDDGEEKVWLCNGGNIHLMPKNKEKTKEVSEHIKKKIGKVKESLEKVISGKTGWLLGKNEGHEQYCRLFAYIRIKIENRNYDMMFFRMAIDWEKEHMECNFESLQFEYWTGCGIKSYTIYPESLEDGYKKYDERGNGYYNPPVRFHSEDDSIAKAFIAFVEEKEKELHQ